MKHIFFFLIIIFSACFTNAQSEVKPDVIVKSNGDIISGKVMEVSDSAVKFTYVNETAVYVLKRTDILKITYSSGRVETFGESLLKSEAAVPATDVASGNSHNKVAVLPFAFLRDDQLTPEAISEKVQTECYSFLARHAGIYTIVDPRTTNALLIKAGVTSDNIKGYTMDEICKLLNVEYVVEGIVSLNSTSQVNSQSSQYKTTTSQNKSKSNDYRTSGYGSSISTQNYSTTIVLSIYNNQGKTVFTQERKSFFTTPDAYKSALEYLLKRVPLYTK